MNNEPGGGNQSNWQEDPDIETKGQETGPSLKDEIYEELYDEAFEYSEKYQQLEDALYEDGDLIKDKQYLQQMASLSTVQRITLLTQSARKTYTSPEDFEVYFRDFPRDAQAVIAVCVDKMKIGNMPDFTLYQLSCKVFEAAAKTIPGYWVNFKNQIAQKHHSTQSEQWPIYLKISERSKRARSHLVGDYKRLPSNLFGVYGEDLYGLTSRFLDRVEDIVNLQDWGYANFHSEILENNHYQQLPQEQKAAFLSDIIAYCNNAIVFHEVYNSYYSEENAVANPRVVTVGQKEDGSWDERVIGPGPHSILYNTDHQEYSFQMPEYEEFETDRWETDKPRDEAGYEKTIEAAIEELGRVGLETDIPRVLSFWDKNRDPAYGPTIAKTITSIGVSSGAGEILSRLKEAEPLDQRRLVSLLFRLELGKVGISDQGLEYLGRRFDLGKHNNPNHFAHRLTSDGKVGIFDEEHRLQGAVQMQAEDFSAEHEGRIAKTVMDITYEMLFESDPEETQAEKAKREAILEEFRTNYFDTYIGLFGEQSKLCFNDLELPEQAWVLQYLHGADEDAKDVFFKFIAKFGEDGFRAFRSLEFGEEMAGCILTIAEQADIDIAKNIFNQYSKIVGLTEQVLGFAQQNLNPDVFNEENRQRIKIGLLRRGGELIKSYAQNLPNKNVIRRELADMVAECLLLSESFKVAKRNNLKLELEDFNTSIEVQTGEQLGSDEKTRDEIIRIFNLNWDNQESAAAYPPMLKELEGALNDASQRFYLIRQGDEIIGFQRFRPYDVGEVYAASNNVRKTAQGSGIGGLAQKKILDWEASHHRVVAHAYSGHNAVSHYLSKDGFVAVGIEQYKDTGDLDFRLVRDDRRKEKYVYSSASREDVIEKYRSHQVEGGAKIEHVNFEDKLMFYILVNQKTHSEGMVVTAFYHDPERRGFAYVVFEKSQERPSYSEMTRQNDLALTA